MGIIVRTGGWLTELPEGTAFVDTYDTGVKAYDVNGNELKTQKPIGADGEAIVSVPNPPHWTQLVWANLA